VGTRAPPRRRAVLISFASNLHSLTAELESIAAQLVSTRPPVASRQPDPPTASPHLAPSPLRLTSSTTAVHHAQGRSRVRKGPLEQDEVKGPRKAPLVLSDLREAVPRCASTFFPPPRSPSTPYDLADTSFDFLDAGQWLPVSYCNRGTLAQDVGRRRVGGQAHRRLHGSVPGRVRRAAQPSVRSCLSPASPTLLVGTRPLSTGASGGRLVRRSRRGSAPPRRSQTRTFSLTLYRTQLGHQTCPHQPGLPGVHLRPAPPPHELDRASLFPSCHRGGPRPFGPG